MKKTSATPAPARSTGRSRAARSNAKLGSIQATIEGMFGLPAGSVRLVGPGRRLKITDDTTVGELRGAWEGRD